jgi:hypothetical protein
VTVLVLLRVKISCDYGINNCKDSDTRVVGNLRDPTKRSRDILLQAKGSLGSSSLRSDGSLDDQEGEADPVEQKSAEAKGPSGCHPSGRQPRQPGGGQRARIKKYCHDNS